MSAMIQIQDIGKKYRLQGASPYLSLRELVSRPLQILSRDNKEDFWALQDINLSIEKGERVGIIGRNGAGKSTLLKIISRITPPTKGRITIEGRVASLLEVGTGFHPELTGRENVYFNGSILGLRKKEIDRKLDEIIAFSGIEKFIDTPLKHYSSGMQLRLAFSVAAHLEPEILLIDEVLAVGDIEFQKKCIGKMDEVSKTEGRTILFITHNMVQVQQICNRVVVLDHGKIVADGKTAETITSYKKMALGAGDYHWQQPANGSNYSINRISIKNQQGELVDLVASQVKHFLELEVNAGSTISNSLIAIRFTNEENIAAYTTTNGDDQLAYPVIQQGKHIYRIPVPFDLFTPGSYELIIAWIIPNKEVLFRVADAIHIEVENSNYPGHILLDGRKETFSKPVKWEEL